MLLTFGQIFAGRFLRADFRDFFFLVDIVQANLFGVDFSGRMFLDGFLVSF